MLSVPVVIIFMIVACLLIYFLIREIFKYLNGEQTIITEDDKEVINIERLPLPKPIEEMTEFLIASICRKIYEVYVKFDYVNATEEQLLEKQWHTWQVSMLLKLYKYNQEFYIPSREHVLHKSLVSLNLKSLEGLVHDILIKYKNNVRISQSKDDLCKDIIWSVRDVTILFCFLSKYREI